MAEQPKKPVGGSYGSFLADKRAEIKASLPEGSKITEVSKKAGELFKALGVAEKKKYDDAYAKASADYKEAFAKFTADGGVKKGKKMKKIAKLKPSADQPKAPAGGAYGQFLKNQREEIKKSLPANHKITDVTKKASEIWKKIGEADMAKWSKMYEKAKVDYAEAIEKFKADGGVVIRAGKSAGSKGEVDECDDKADEDSPKKSTKKSPKKSPPTKSEKKDAGDVVKPSPKAKAAGKRKAIKADEKGMELGEPTLKQARNLGFESQLVNLSKRSDVMSSGKTPEDLLKALESSGGLVNKARAALLGA